MSSRVLHLKGASNFRDLGGYPTSSSRETSWRSIFRSAKLSTLHDDDLQIISECNIRSVVDLRTIAEQTAHPSRWRKPPDTIYTSAKTNNDEVIDLFVRGIGSEGEAVDRMRAFYADLPFRYRDEFAALFSLLDRQDGATLIHCTAGKDRTGVACALVLSALGVHKSALVEDYALTETLLEMAELARTPAEHIGGANEHGVLESLPPAARRILWGSDPSFIGAAFESLERHFGSVDSYLEKALLVDKDMRARLQDRYTADIQRSH